MRQNNVDKIFNIKSIRGIIAGSIVGIITIIALFLLLSVVIMQLDTYPHQIINYLILGILGISGLFAGYIAGLINKISGLIYGGITGLAIFVLVFIAGLLSVGNGITLFTLLKLLVLVISSALGGILGVNKKDKLHIK